jgi:hypothetical protein
MHFAPQLPGGGTAPTDAKLIGKSGVPLSVGRLRLF